MGRGERPVSLAAGGRAPVGENINEHSWPRKTEQLRFRATQGVEGSEMHTQAEGT